MRGDLLQYNFSFSFLSSAFFVRIFSVLKNNDPVNILDLLATQLHGHQPGEFGHKKNRESKELAIIKSKKT